MNFELSGKIIEIYNVNQVNERFKKREFVIEKTENNGGMVFTDTIKFQLTQDRVSLIDNFKLGDEVKVNFNIKGNRWERDGRVNYFINLDAWKIEPVSQLANTTMEEPPTPSLDDLPPEEEEDDLPF